MPEEMPIDKAINICHNVLINHFFSRSYIEQPPLSLLII